MTVKDEVAAVLRKLAEKNGGVLTPDAVVAEAKSPKSVLHDQFDWDDKSAAQQHRIEQARRLIRSVRIEVQTTTRTITSVAYVRDPRAEPKEQGYVPVETLRDDIDLAREAVAFEFAKAAAAMARTRDLAVVLNIGDEVDRLIEGIEALRRPLFARPGDSAPPVQ